MHDRFQGLGLHAAQWQEGIVRGHSFHHSSLQTSLPALGYTRKVRDGSQGEALYQQGSVRASYFHAYFPSNPEAIAACLSRSI